MAEFCQSDLMLHFLSAVIQYCHAAIHLHNRIVAQRCASVEGGDNSLPPSAKSTTNEEGAITQYRRVEEAVTLLAVHYGKVLLSCRYNRASGRVTTN